jgi:hypothetical protein
MFVAQGHILALMLVTIYNEDWQRRAVCPALFFFDYKNFLI